VEQGAQYASARIPCPHGWKPTLRIFLAACSIAAQRKDVNLPINEQLIVELYSK
jgi:hypothetical protein